MPCTLRLFVPKSRNNCNGICCVKYFICSCQRSVHSCSAVCCMERVWSKPVARSALKHVGSRSAGQYTWCKEKEGCRWLGGAACRSGRLRDGDGIDRWLSGAGGSLRLSSVPGEGSASGCSSAGSGLSKRVFRCSSPSASRMWRQIGCAPRSLFYSWCCFFFFFFNSYLCIVLIPVHDKAFGLIALQALCINLISFGKELHSWDSPLLRNLHKGLPAFLVRKLPGCVAVLPLSLQFYHHWLRISWVLGRPWHNSPTFKLMERYYGFKTS